MIFDYGDHMNGWGWVFMAVSTRTSTGSGWKPCAPAQAPRSDPALEGGSRWMTMLTVCGY